MRCGGESSAEGATEAFPATDVKLNATPLNHEGPCPATINFAGEIMASGAGTITYTFVRSDGAKGPVFTLNFDRAGTRRVSTTWTLGGSRLPEFAGWIRLKILSPNVLESKDANFKVRCR